MYNIDVEILAPAGSYESLKAAINAGADAVYIGGEKFGARAYADNPDEDMLLEAIDYVHLHGKKIYLTVNTLLKNNELKNELYNYLLPYYVRGLDAVIVQDLGVYNFIKENFPGLDIHASTQMLITGCNGAKLLEELGVTRIVTARELSCEEIKEIKDNCNIEIESFVHGALCYCYSGECLMSSMFGGRSGNRGRCAGPCRLPYDVKNNRKLLNNNEDKYVLSPKDICTIRILPDIIKSGVYSLKIEGRMKSPEYTAGVVSIYRKYVDLIKKNGFDNYEVNDKDYRKLEQIYSRSGFNEGYYHQYNGKNMMTFKKPSYSGQNDELIREINARYVSVDKKLGINGYIKIAENEPIIFTVYSGDASITEYGSLPLKALNKPVTEEVILKQITKTGNTPYEFEDVTVDISGNVFVPIKELNELRRRTLETFTNELLSGYRRNNDNTVNNIVNSTTIKDFNVKFSDKSDSKSNNIVCLVSNIAQFEVCAENEHIDTLYISLDSMDITEEMVNKCHKNNKKICLALPYIFRKEAKAYFKNHLEYIKSLGIDGLLIRNVDEIHFAKENLKDIPLIFDYYVYSMNDEAVRLHKNLGAIGYTESIELNYKELIKKDIPCGEIVAYGYIPLMVTAGCINKNINACTKMSEEYIITDRYNTDFKVKNICRFCYNLIFNSLPISLLSVSREIKNISPAGIRLQFVDESKEETANIIKKYVKTFVYDEIVDEIEPSTRGHFKRGIE